MAKNITKKLLISIVVICSALVALISASLAWFVDAYYINPEISGSALTGYFYGGTGTKDDPYQLNAPVHVYNLAWLQYMGELNHENSEGKIDQLYFELISDIDMDGMILPPIGTTDNPFVGHFDGNGHCISGLTVSNYLDGDGAEFGIEERPLSVTTLDADSVEIIGFFGVVGPMTPEMEAKLADDSAATEISSKVNAVHDLFLDGLTVRTDTERSLMGLLAGYVNGSLSNVGIGESTLVVEDGVLPLSSEDLINMQMTVSAYSLLGSYDDDNVDWVDIPSSSGGEGDSEGAGWGGSLDIYEMIRRVSYMFTENIKQTTKNTYPVTFYNYGNINYTYTSTTNRQTAYIAKTSLISLNADTETMFAGEDSLVNSYPTNTYYSTHSNEIVSDNNTGYIVGGGGTSTAWIRMRIEPMANGSYGGIYKSIGTAKNASPSFNRSNFEMLTIDESGAVYVIKDDFNTNASTALTGTEATYSELGFKQYESVVSSFSSVLTGKTMVYGLRFQPTSTQGITIENNNVTSTTTEGDISLFGENYTGYELIDGAINFKVKTPGLITTIAGTFAQASGNHSFFNLIEVTRDSNNKITGARVIEKIWVKYSGASIIDIQYNSDIPDTTGYSLVYSEENMNTLTSTQTAYYFEIPVKAGDYALGALKGSSTGAYLMYLDIGASGEEDNSGSGTTTVPVHQISGVNFVDDAAIMAGTTAEYSQVTFNVDVNDILTVHTGLTMTFERTSATAMSYSVSNADQFAITPMNTDVTLTQVAAQATANADALMYYGKKRDYA